MVPGYSLNESKTRYLRDCLRNVALREHLSVYLMIEIPTLHPGFLFAHFNDLDG